MRRSKYFPGLVLFILFVVSMILTSPNIFGDSILKDKETDRFENFNGHKFSFDLFSEIVKTDTGNNIFVSPLSAMYALAMTINGAVGQTGQEMKDVLGLNDSEIDELNRYLKALTIHLTTVDKKVELSIANSIWSQPGFSFRPDFIKMVKENYDAELDILSDPDIINAWVSEKTKGRIPKIIDKLSTENVMVLINALYFKGKWTKQFKKGSTQDHDFHLSNGSIKKHPLMYQSDKFNYFENSDFQAISLPYGDKHLSMYVILPSEESGLDRFLGQLNSENWAEWNRQFRWKEGKIYLPRFKMEYSIKLKSILIEMGMPSAFDRSRDDLTDMVIKKADENYFITSVLQKTFVEVNEEGTEAAAATAVSIGIRASMNPERPFMMKVDRPFFCAIVDHKTEELLFMGAIYNPEE